MEPVEINAGEFYLRQLRADDRVDDRVALVGGGLVADMAAASAHIAERDREWADDERCTWAVCEQLTGTAVGEVALAMTGELTCWTTPDHRGRGIATHATSAVLRFGFGFLELPAITCAPTDEAGRRVAGRCGFSPGARPGVWTRLR
ncbi:GNAT family N-acetyltransferase [Saccharothrix coeruleofusca]|nr:GNAT family N-acetyltransferase [Saccharothrix coeruleofusca]MBP2339163.1 RimJ/RimL family protein N-acetyltransferase [Saccharothrix coeruleofusca]